MAQVSAWIGEGNSAELPSSNAARKFWSAPAERSGDDALVGSSAVRRASS